ncbi:MAG: hypothetical protein HOO04_06760 [Phycisphaerae bacterium]|nr:hypothetical protein [Phycisphaerae bacterium]
MPFIAVVASLFLMAGETPMAGIMVLAVGCGWLVLHNIGQAIRWNNGKMAVLVAVFRLGFAVVWLLALFMIFGLLNPKGKDGRGNSVNKTAAQLAIAAALAWGIWRLLTAYITPPGNGTAIDAGSD